MVKRFHQLVGLGCDNGKRPDLLTVGGRPHLPDTGEGKGSVILECDSVRNLPIRSLLPLIKTIRQDQASLFPERDSKRQLLKQRFRPCIDHPVSDFLLLGPGRDQSPPTQGNGGWIIVENQGQVLGWGRIVVGPEIFRAEYLEPLHQGTCGCVY